MIVYQNVFHSFASGSTDLCLILEVTEVEYKVLFAIQTVKDLFLISELKVNL